jgi:hypothetical protein
VRVRPWKEPYAAVELAVPAGELDRALVGLRARVGEEHATAAAEERVQPGRDLGLDVVVIEVRDVQQCRRLVGDRGRDLGMGVAERRDREPGEEVEVLLAVGVPEVGARAAHERDRQATVGLHDVLGVERPELGEGTHAASTSVAPSRGVAAGVLHGPHRRICAWPVLMSRPSFRRPPA